MGAPTGDAILKPIVFLVCLMATFIIILQAMTSTIENNQQTSFYLEDRVNVPEYMQMFQNGSYDFWTPNPYHMEGWLVDLESNFDGSREGTNVQCDFCNTADPDHEIHFGGVDRWTGEVNKDRHGFFFHQHGGIVGLKSWQWYARFPEDFDLQKNNVTGEDMYLNTIHLRHEYFVLLTGNYNTTLYNSIMLWHFDIAIYEILDQEVSANPWVIVGQFFTFNLPGIPLWLNLLLMTPIMVAVGVIAFILIRGALPA